jgi:hypothetical protein
MSGSCRTDSELRLQRQFPRLSRNPDGEDTVARTHGYERYELLGDEALAKETIISLTLNQLCNPTINCLPKEPSEDSVNHF